MHVKIGYFPAGELESWNDLPMTRFRLPAELYLINAFFIGEVPYEVDFADLDEVLDSAATWNGEGNAPSWGGNACIANFARDKVFMYSVGPKPVDTVEISRAAFDRLYDLWKRGVKTGEIIEEDIPELEIPA